MSQKVIVSIISGLIITLILSISQFMYVIKTLDTDPPMIERIIALEFKTSEMGKTMDSINKVLSDLSITINAVHLEQSRRKPMVDYVEGQMNSGHDNYR